MASAMRPTPACLLLTLQSREYAVMGFADDMTPARPRPGSRDARRKAGKGSNTWAACVTPAAAESAAAAARAAHSAAGSPPPSAIKGAMPTAREPLRHSFSNASRQSSAQGSHAGQVRSCREGSGEEASAGSSRRGFGCGCCSGGGGVGDWVAALPAAPSPLPRPPRLLALLLLVAAAIAQPSSLGAAALGCGSSSAVSGERMRRQIGQSADGLRSTARSVSAARRKGFEDEERKPRLNPPGEAAGAACARAPPPPVSAAPAENVKMRCCSGASPPPPPEAAAEASPSSGSREIASRTSDFRAEQRSGRSAPSLSPPGDESGVGGASGPAEVGAKSWALRGVAAASSCESAAGGRRACGFQRQLLARRRSRRHHRCRRRCGEENLRRLPRTAGRLVSAARW